MKNVFVLAAALVIGASVAAPAPASSSVILRSVRPGNRIANIAGREFGPLAFLRSAFHARYVGPAKLHGMAIEVDTPLRNEAGLTAYAKAASTPGSAYYRHWLTPAQIAGAYGTPQASYNAVAAYFKSYGLTVGTWPMRSSINITGTQAQMEKALGTTFGTYELTLSKGHIAKSFVVTAPLTEPTVKALFPQIAFKKLVSLRTMFPHFMTTQPPVAVGGGLGSNYAVGYTPQQIAKAFDYQGAYDLGYTGAGINFGIIGTGGISPNDVPNFKKIFNVTGSSTLTEVAATINGDTTPPPVTGPCAASATSALPVNLGAGSTSPTAACNPEDYEAQLDTEQASTLARDASVRFYLAYNSEGCEIISSPTGTGCIGPNESEQGLGDPDDEIDTAIADDKSDVISISYGGCETIEGVPELSDVTINPGGDATGHGPDEFSMLAAEGVAVFVSTGDSGSAACEGGLSPTPAINYPSDDPNVVAVGGTTTPIGSDGRLTGPMTTWGEQTESGGAETAGVSVLFETPPYQKNLLSACTMRCVPDVTMDGDPFTGVPVVFDTGLAGGAMAEPFGGTSVAAPQMAAMWALVLSACKATPSCGGGYGSNVSDPVSGYTAPAGTAYRLGNPNYYWYKLAAASQASTYHSTFYDIVYGNDGEPLSALGLIGSTIGLQVSEYAAGIDAGSVNAGPGLDEATGLGAPFGRALIKYVVGV